MRRLSCFAVFLCSLTPALFAQQGDRQNEVQGGVPAHIEIPPAPVRSAEEERATFKLAPGFRAELVAAEPLVVAPIAAEFAPATPGQNLSMARFLREPR